MTKSRQIEGLREPGGLWREREIEREIEKERDKRGKGEGVYSNFLGMIGLLCLWDFIAATDKPGSQDAGGQPVH